MFNRKDIFINGCITNTEFLLKYGLLYGSIISDNHFIISVISDNHYDKYDQKWSQMISNKW